MFIQVNATTAESFIAKLQNAMVMIANVQEKISYLMKGNLSKDALVKYIKNGGQKISDFLVF